jgi:hypothetical protein
MLERLVKKRIGHIHRQGGRSEAAGKGRHRSRAQKTRKETGFFGHYQTPLGTNFRTAPLLQ